MSRTSAAAGLSEPDLTWEESVYYRDRLRDARYAALADAEGFGEVCFAVEALGLRLSEKEGALGSYKKSVRGLSVHSTVLCLSHEWPLYFSTFDALYETVTNARNDAMHTGAYARHATSAAIELCIGLEEALMNQDKVRRTKVEEFMVKSPVSVEPWQLVAQARHLMLMHSFSFLPVHIDGQWKLVSEFALAKYLHLTVDRKHALASPLAVAVGEKQEPKLELVEAEVVRQGTSIAALFGNTETKQRSFLWLVTDASNHLAGVLSPFELM